MPTQAQYNAMLFNKKKVKPLTKAKKQARKSVDKNQNKAISSLARRIKKLETTTVERKYLTMVDEFNFGGLGQVKSRQLHRYATGSYDGLTTTALFGTTGAEGDFVYARYMIIDVVVQCFNPTALENENNPTTFSMFLLKARKENDLYQDAVSTLATNGLNDGDIISNQAPGQSFVNPKGWKIVKQRHSMIGGVNDTVGFGVAHRRYRMKIPLNKKVFLQRTTTGDTLTQYPQEIQDWLWFVICANGSVTDGREPHCQLSVMLCYDDSGDN